MASLWQEFCKWFRQTWLGRALGLYKETGVVGWTAAEVGEVIDNPLGVKKGEFVRINEIDYSDLDFQVRKVAQVTRRFPSGKVKKHTDYDLIARPLGKDPVKVRLRYVPLPDPDVASNILHTVLWMELYEEHTHSDELMGVFENFDRGEPLEFTDPATGATTATYTRCDGLRSPFSATRVTLDDQNHDGKITADEVLRESISYWDFRRDLPPEEGQRATEELVFVERDDKTYFTEIWTATEISPFAVQTI